MQNLDCGFGQLLETPFAKRLCRRVSGGNQHAANAAAIVGRRQCLALHNLLLFLVLSSGTISAQEALQINRLKVGDLYELSTRASLDGALALPAQNGKAATKLAITGSAHMLFRERVVRADSAGKIDRIMRIYEDVDYQRKVGDQDQEAKLRPAIRTVVIDIRDNDIMPFSPEGPLMWTELEFLRTHPLLTVLEGFVPTSPVKIASTWDVPRTAVVELLAVNPIRSGGLTCRYAENIEFGGKKLAQFAFDGAVTGKTTEGEARSDVAGAVYVDLATRRVHSLRAVGDRILLGPNDEPVGKVKVDYQITIRPAIADPGLTDAVVGKLPVKPSADDLAVLYEHPGLGVRLRHPRRWKLATVENGNFVLESQRNSLAIHLEKPSGTPRIDDYAKQVAAYIAKAEALEDQKQRIVVLNKSDPKEDTKPNARAGNFRYRVKIGSDERFLDYWVVERGIRGVTASARILPEEADRLAIEVANIVGSVEFFEPLKPATK